jgi:hypothetical protein
MPTEVRSGGHCAGRENRGAESFEGERGHKARAVDLGFHRERVIPLGEEGVELLTEWAAGRFNDEFDAVEVGECDAIVPEQ